ncbi:hypothetical protein ACFQ9V_01070 [Leifsonia sp. NPDC056665]|uniref:hypothetical protein n=1 Tax=Leifsonia sp. NPDC056665 TaxID=3345901 RepID=UPI0036A82D32
MTNPTPTTPELRAAAEAYFCHQSRLQYRLGRDEVTGLPVVVRSPRSRARSRGAQLVASKLKAFDALQADTDAARRDLVDQWARDVEAAEADPSADRLLRINGLQDAWWLEETERVRVNLPLFAAIVEAWREADGELYPEEVVEICLERGTEYPEDDDIAAVRATFRPVLETVWDITRRAAALWDTFERPGAAAEVASN